jgi:hypothetical protein
MMRGVGRTVAAVMNNRALKKRHELYWPDEWPSAFQELFNVHLPYEPAHVIYCVANLTEAKFCVNTSIFEFPTGARKYVDNATYWLPNEDVMVCVMNGRWRTLVPTARHKDFTSADLLFFLLHCQDMDKIVNENYCLVGGDTFPWNVGKHLPDYMESHHSQHRENSDHAQTKNIVRTVNTLASRAVVMQRPWDGRIYQGRFWATAR